MLEQIRMIQVVAEGLEELVGECVFVGGATTTLYLDSAVFEPRPTDDVDCVVNIFTQIEYALLEDKLRAKGFVNDTRKDAPLCRFRFQGVTVDVMPPIDAVLGFSNRWYEDGARNKISAQLPNGKRIQLFSAPYFIATKLEAYKHRGQSDPRTSHDIEDALYVINGRSKLIEEVSLCDSNLKKYFGETIRELLKQRDFIDAVSIHLEGEHPDRIPIVLGYLDSLAKL